MQPVTGYQFAWADENNVQFVNRAWIVAYRISQVDRKKWLIYVTLLGGAEFAVHPGYDATKWFKSLEEANQAAQEVPRLETARDVNNYLREQTRRILPEILG